MQVISPLVLLACMTPFWWACAIVPVTAVLGTLVRSRLVTAVACYISQLAVRNLQVYFSVPVVIVTFFAWLLLVLTLIEMSGEFGDADSAGAGAHGTFEKLQNAVPRGCSDAAVSAVLSATNFYEVCICVLF